MSERVRRRIDKYLEVYGEPATRDLLRGIPRRTWEEVVVVPARDEEIDLLATLREPASTTARTLLVLVVNGVVASRANEELLDRFTLARNRRAWPHSWLSAQAEADVLVVDRASTGRRMGVREGVGTARKIGADLALALQREGAVASPWIHMTDADARLPADHFQRISAIDDDFVAHVADFRHVASGDGEVDEATYAYERWLRYYVLGLAFAGSPCAHHSIGSLISVRGGAYAAVRGVPRRQAGEDFYLLDKLRKVGGIARARASDVRILARDSSRVPFGTGPAVARALHGAEPTFLDPRCFAALGQWLTVLDLCVSSGDLQGSFALCSPQLIDALTVRGELAAVEQLCRRHRGPQLARQLRVAFAGLRTLKLLHSLRDRAWPSLAWAEVRERAPFLGGIDGEDAESDCRWSAARERVCYPPTQVPSEEYSLGASAPSK